MFKKVLLVHKDEFAISALSKKLREKGFEVQWSESDRDNLPVFLEKNGSVVEILVIDQFAIGLPLLDCIKWTKVLQEEFNIPKAVILRHDEITFELNTRIQLVDFVRSRPDDVVKFIESNPQEPAYQS